MKYFFNEFIIEDVIFYCKAGSLLYGTATVNSDIDIKGVFIPSVEEIISPNTIEVKTYKTNKSNNKNSNKDIDITFIGLEKYLRLLSKADMSSVELLFSKNIIDNTIWDSIIENKDKFINPNLPSFKGYIKKCFFNRDKLTPKELAHCFRIIDQFYEYKENKFLIFPCKNKDKYLEIREDLSLKYKDNILYHLKIIDSFEEIPFDNREFINSFYRKHYIDKIKNIS